MTTRTRQVGRKRKLRSPRLTAKTADRHKLYEASVQNVGADLDFFQRQFRKHRGRPLRRLKEDFCGTAALATAFVARHPENRAWGVDLHRPTLNWGLRHHVSRLNGEQRKRLTLLCKDVRDVSQPKVDLVAALNFSYFTFKSRDLLRAYFRSVYRSLNEDGILVLDTFGGTDAMDEMDEERKIEATVRPDGERIPSFTYIWDQARFNTITHDILCYIHFKFSDRTMMKRAFTYDWRLWTLPELQELLREAGFSHTEVYMEGWDDEDDESDGIFRRRTYFENMAGWIAYVVGIR
jgi:cyclopropane fatty-acyl-phospholipid synthase-like methyltransferase